MRVAAAESSGDAIATGPSDARARASAGTKEIEAARAVGV
jgi:hypothetical protein